MKARTVVGIVVLLLVLLSTASTRIEAQGACPGTGSCRGDFLLVQQITGHCIAAVNVDMLISAQLLEWVEPSTGVLYRFYTTAGLTFARVPPGVNPYVIAGVLGVDFARCVPSSRR